MTLAQNEKNLHLRKNEDNTISIISKNNDVYSVSDLFVDLKMTVSNNSNYDPSLKTDILMETGYILPFSLIYNYIYGANYKIIFKDAKFRTIVEDMYNKLKDHRRIIVGSKFL